MGQLERSGYDVDIEEGFGKPDQCVSATDNDHAKKAPINTAPGRRDSFGVVAGEDKTITGENHPNEGDYEGDDDQEINAAPDETGNKT